MGHVFEQAGLGRAPFRFVGMEHTAAEANADGMVKYTDAAGIEMWTKPGGTCAYCGNYIVNFCWIEDADGKRFKVGSECVNKTGDKGVVNEVKRAVNKARTKARRAREATRIAECKAALETDTVRAALSGEPHPLAWRAERGDTLADWADWMLANAGNAGKLEVARVVARIG